MISDCEGLAQEDESTERTGTSTLEGTNSVQDMFQICKGVMSSKENREVVHFPVSCLEPLVCTKDNFSHLFVAILPLFSSVGTLFDLELGRLITVNVNASSTCEAPHHAPCRPETGYCFDRGATCVYDTTDADEARGRRVQRSCRNGAHLRIGCGACAQEEQGFRTSEVEDHPTFGNFSL